VAIVACLWGSECSQLIVGLHIDNMCTFLLDSENRLATQHSKFSFESIQEDGEEYTTIVFSGNIDGE